MTTKLEKCNEKSIAEAIELLKAGKIVALPTETVYGLAADAKNEDAVKEIFIAKGRPQDNPLIVHIATEKQLFEIAKEVPPKALSLAKEYWPGPLTMIFKKTDVIPDLTTGGLDSVAVRMPSNPVIREIIEKSGVMIAAPSANISGRPSGTTARDVFEDFDGKIPLVLDGGECKIGIESTVISFATEIPTLFRPGFVTAEELAEKLGEIKIADAVLKPLKSGERVQSPGMKYKHYSPKAEVKLVRGSEQFFDEFFAKNSGEKVFALCFDREKKQKNMLFYGARENLAEQAKNIFSKLRETDRLGAETVYVECPCDEGVGLATLNRLLRSAGFEVIEEE